MSMLSAYQKYINLIYKFKNTDILENRKLEFENVGYKNKFPLFPYIKYNNNFDIAIDYYVRDCINNYKTEPIFEICDILIKLNI